MRVNTSAASSSCRVLRLLYCFINYSCYSYNNIISIDIDIIIYNYIISVIITFELPGYSTIHHAVNDVNIAYFSTATRKAPWAMSNYDYFQLQTMASETEEITKEKTYEHTSTHDRNCATRDTNNLDSNTSNWARCPLLHYTLGVNCCNVISKSFTN